MKQEVSISDVLQEKNQKEKEKKYNAYVKQVTPKHNCCVNTGKAFLVGGMICLLGQILQTVYSMLGANKEDAGLYCTITLIFFSALLTGLNLYPRIAKWGGAGTIVPITGFANSVAAPALDKKVEGFTFGIGSNIFIIAGPVILYGIFSSWVLGLVYWIGKVVGIM